MGTVVNQVLSSMDGGSLKINHTIEQSDVQKILVLFFQNYQNQEPEEKEPGTGRKKNKGRRREIMRRK